MYKVKMGIDNRQNLFSMARHKFKMRARSFKEDQRWFVFILSVAEF